MREKKKPKRRAEEKQKCRLKFFLSFRRYVRNEPESMDLFHFKLAFEKRRECMIGFLSLLFHKPKKRFKNKKYDVKKIGASVNEKQEYGKRSVDQEKEKK